MNQTKENAVVIHEQTKTPAVVGESAAVLSMIERAATNPEVDIDKMERLLVMHERMQGKQAEALFSADLSAMQPELPVVTERGQILNKSGGVQSTYARWEDINEAIKPVLARFGFALSFRTNTSQGIHVIGVLSHRGGHRETTEILLPADNSGNKNVVQSIASSVSYGKRYTAGALLNLTSRGEDDDGQSATPSTPTSQPEPVGPPEYPQDSFNQNFPKWKKLIEAGTKTVGAVIATIQSKYTITEPQRKALQSIKIVGAAQ